MLQQADKRFLNNIFGQGGLSREDGRQPHQTVVLFVVQAPEVGVGNVTHDGCALLSLGL
jgi:hypothetical protein